jgi:hypothetical protein
MDALGWLNVLDAISEPLSSDYDIRRLDWRWALVEQPMPQSAA